MRGHVLWPLAGYAHLSVDTRGQGLGRMGGATPDPVAGFEGEIPGWMTKGIRDPETAYYRRVFTDAVRAVDVARVLPPYCVSNECMRTTRLSKFLGGEITQET